MEFKKNLNIQKIYFPKIYNSYLKSDSKEIAATKLEEFDEAEAEKFIQIICNKPYDVLRKVFMVPEYMLHEYNLDDYEEFNLVKSVYESSEDFEKKLKINYLIPFNIKYNNVIISKKINKHISYKRNRILILKENLDIFEKRYLKDIGHKVENLSNLSELETKLLEFRPAYNIQHLIMLNIIEKKQHNQGETLKEDYKNTILSDLIKIIIEHNEESSKIIVEKLGKQLISSYEKEGLTIVSSFLKEGNFLNNFKIVDIYIKNKQELLNLITGNYWNGIEKYVVNLKGNKKSRQIALFLDGEIKALDAILSISLNNLIDNLRRNGDEK